MLHPSTSCVLANVDKNVEVRRQQFECYCFIRGQTEKIKMCSLEVEVEEDWEEQDGHKANERVSRKRKECASLSDKVVVIIVESFY